MTSDLENAVEYIQRVVRHGGPQEYAAEQLHKAHFSPEVVEEALSVHKARGAPEQTKQGPPPKPYHELKVPEPKSKHRHHTTAGTYYRYGFIAAPILALLLLIAPATRIAGLLLLGAWALLFINTAILWLIGTMFEHIGRQTFWQMMTTAAAVLGIFLIVLGAFLTLGHDAIIFGTVLLVFVLTFLLSLFFNMKRQVALVVALVLIAANYGIGYGVMVGNDLISESMGIDEQAIAETEPTLLGMARTEQRSFTDESTPSLIEIREDRYGEGDARILMLTYAFTSDALAEQMLSRALGFTHSDGLLVREEAHRCVGAWSDGHLLFILLSEPSSDCASRLARAARELRT